MLCIVSQPDSSDSLAKSVDEGTPMDSVEGIVPMEVPELTGVECGGLLADGGEASLMDVEAEDAGVTSGDSSSPELASAASWSVTGFEGS